MDFKRASQSNNPELVICQTPSQFKYEVNLLHQMTRELASVSGTCSTDDEDCGEVNAITDFYDFSSVPSTDVTQVAEDEEGSGSGSGSIPVDELCNSLLPNNNVQFEEESGSSPTSLSAALLFTLALTALLLAMGNPWSL